MAHKGLDSDHGAHLSPFTSSVFSSSFSSSAAHTKFTPQETVQTEATTTTHIGASQSRAIAWAVRPSAQLQSTHPTLAAHRMLVPAPSAFSSCSCSCSSSSTPLRRPPPQVPGLSPPLWRRSARTARSHQRRAVQQSCGNHVPRVVALHESHRVEIRTKLRKVNYHRIMAHSAWHTHACTRRCAGSPQGAADVTPPARFDANARF